MINRSPLHARTFLSAVALGLFAAADPSVFAETLVLTNVSQVRALTQKEAAQGLPVRLEGTVIALSDPYERAVILADRTAGIYLLAEANLFAPYRRMDMLQVEGVTDPGGFAPIVRVTSASKVGVGALPEPRPVTYQQLITGSLDAQWVEITGVVRGIVEPDPGSDIWRILLSSDGGVVPVRGPIAQDPMIQVDAEVRVQAVCLYQFNRRRQVLNPVLSVPPGLKVHVEKPAPTHPFDAPVRSAQSLLQFSPEVPFGHRVHVRGVVLHAQLGSFIWLRDASSVLRIQARQQESLQAGDVVDVLGFPVYGVHSPVLEDAVFRKTGSQQPAAPIVLTHAAATFDHEDDLIQLEALLMEVQPVLEGVSFTFAVDETIFKGLLKLPEGSLKQDEWPPGSKVRVTGICSLIHDDVRPLMGVWQPQAFQVLLRSAGDLLVLENPPWWTPRRVIYVLATALAGLLLVIGIISLVSRHHLKEQARHRAMAEAEFSAILAERNRMAREIHDTLAQGLGAISMHLENAKDRLSSTSADGAIRHLELAHHEARTSLAEARNSIWNMRSQVLEKGDLGSALEGVLKQLSTGADVEASIRVLGRVRRLPTVTENNLLRIGQEAITNAIRHAKARRIEAILEFADKQVKLRVADDGCGFDPDRPPASQGSFGLVGMRERATLLRSTFTLRSQPDQGTEVSLIAPVPSSSGEL